MSSEVESISDNDEVVRVTENNGDAGSENEVEGETNENEPQTEDKNDSADESKKKEVKPKRVVKRLQPKFNEHTIRNPKGLPAIKNHFKNLKLRGKGYEEHDLNLIMKTYEYWSHRFFPKYTFDDSIARLEVLGTKRGTQTYLRRFRMGLDDYDENQKIQIDDEIPKTGFEESFNDPFDQLIAPNNHDPEPELSEELVEKIRLNKLRAEAIRKERQSRINELNQSTSQQPTQMEVDEGQEMDLDDILDMINEEPSTSNTDIPITTHTQKNDETISNSIRSARFKLLLYNSSDEEDENIIKLQKDKKNIDKPLVDNYIKDINKGTTELETSDSESDNKFHNKKYKRKSNQQKKISGYYSDTSEDDNAVQPTINKFKKKAIIESDEDSNFPLQSKTIAKANGKESVSSINQVNAVESDKESYNLENDISQKSNDSNKETSHSEIISVKTKKKSLIVTDDNSDSSNNNEFVATSSQRYINKNANGSIIQNDSDSNDLADRSSQKLNSDNEADITATKQRKKSRPIIDSDEENDADKINSARTE